MGITYIRGLKGTIYLTFYTADNGTMSFYKIYKI